MEKTQRRLGRGLDSLVSVMPTSQHQAGAADRGATPSPQSGAAEHSPFRRVSIELLKPNRFQPRGAITDEQLRALVESIRQSGMIQPITARPDGERFEIIAGERRWRAARLAGLTDVPVIVREANDEQLLEIAIIENVQREDLNAIERAAAYQTYCSRFGLNAESVAARLGEDRTTVTNYMRLLTLPAAVKDLVATGQLSMGQARTLLGVNGDAERTRLAELAVTRDLSVRALEELVRIENPRPTEPTAPTAPLERKTSNVKDLEKKLERAVRTRVTIKEGRKKGSGRIVIEFYTLDDFDRIAGLLGMRDD